MRACLMCTCTCKLVRMCPFNWIRSWRICFYPLSARNESWSKIRAARNFRWLHSVCTSWKPTRTSSFLSSPLAKRKNTHSYRRWHRRHTTDEYAACFVRATISEPRACAFLCAHSERFDFRARISANGHGLCEHRAVVFQFHARRLRKRRIHSFYSWKTFGWSTECARHGGAHSHGIARLSKHGFLLMVMKVLLIFLLLEKHMYKGK